MPLAFSRAHFEGLPFQKQYCDYFLLVDGQTKKEEKHQLGWNPFFCAAQVQAREGEYASVYSGRSMELNDLREYVRGDDVRDLEWKASARSGQLLVKRFIATRKLKNMVEGVRTVRRELKR